MLWQVLNPGSSKRQGALSVQSHKLQSAVVTQCVAQCDWHVCSLPPFSLLICAFPHVFLFSILQFSISFHIFLDSLSFLFFCFVCIDLSLWLLNYFISVPDLFSFPFLTFSVSPALSLFSCLLFPFFWSVFLSFIYTFYCNFTYLYLSASLFVSP